jgi:hypothetical protein
MKNLSEQSVDELQERVGRILIAQLTDRAPELDKLYASLHVAKKAKKRSSINQSSAYRDQATV